MKEEMKEGINKIFDSFVGGSLFKNKAVLQSNYNPEAIMHRDKEIGAVASILAPILRGERASNLFLYGGTGSGKTISVQYVGTELARKINELGKNRLKYVYINCKLKKVADTEYRILAEIINSLGGKVPATGLPTDRVYKKFIELIDDKKQVVLIVLDEIDQAVKKINDDFIYSLTRMNSELRNAQISLIGISNSLNFMDNLDPRVRSSLGEEELLFSSYNALQLQDILKERAGRAFIEGVIEEGVIAKCAAFAAREHGDARRALDLLRVAGEIAEREGNKKILLRHIDAANQKIERDKTIDSIENAPRQFQLVLHSVMQLNEMKSKGRKTGSIFTGDVYNAYNELCRKTKNEALTQRRVSDIIAELDMLGIINARVISKGRQGRTREIKLMMPANINGKAFEILEDALSL